MADEPTPTPDPVEPVAEPAAEPRTFTQEQLDRIVQDRLARAKQAPPADYEDLKAAAARLAELEEANKTELQKAQDRATQLEKDAAEARELAQRTKVESAIVAEAARRGADVDLTLDALRSKVEIGEDGTSNVADAMDVLLLAKPFLVTGGARAVSADQGARTGGVNQLTRDELKNLSQAEIIEAQKEGRLDVLLGRAR